MINNIKFFITIISILIIYEFIFNYYENFYPTRCKSLYKNII